MEGVYKIDQIILMKCDFERINNVTFNDPNVKHIVDIKVDCDVKENKVYVRETLIFESKKEDIVEIFITILMLGIFEKFGEVSIEPMEFGQVNGAAILYPYIREQVSNIALKAGMGNVLLPPVNFVKLAQDKKQ